MTENERRHFEVLLEEIHRSVTIVAEGHGTLVDRMDRLDATLDRRFDAMDEKIGWVAESAREARRESEQRDNKLEAKIDGVQEALTKEIRAVGDKVEDHESRIQTLERKAA